MKTIKGKIIETNYESKYQTGVIEYVNETGETKEIDYNQKSLGGGLVLDNFKVQDDVLFCINDLGEVAKLRHFPNSDPNGKDYFLSDWAFISATSIDHLATKKASMERWYYGKAPEYYNFRDKNGNEVSIQKHPLLEIYLNYTFRKLCSENKILFSKIDSKFAAFNTGLVDKAYNDIYGLFEKNASNRNQPWKLVAFMTEGDKYYDYHKKGNVSFLALYKTFPEKAQYFYIGEVENLASDGEKIHEQLKHFQKMFLMPKATIRANFSHIKKRLNRLPAHVLKTIFPQNKIKDEATLKRLSKQELDEYFTELQDILKNDTSINSNFEYRFNHAIETARKRTEWNYKTAIPYYYQRLETITILLPLCFDMKKQTVDVALVVSLQPTGNYEGETILELPQAYSNSRLVTRPESDWLNNEIIKDFSSNDDPNSENNNFDSDNDD